MYMGTKQTLSHLQQHYTQQPATPRQPVIGQLRPAEIRIVQTGQHQRGGQYEGNPKLKQFTANKGTPLRPYKI